MIDCNRLEFLVEKCRNKHISLGIYFDISSEWRISITSMRAEECFVTHARNNLDDAIEDVINFLDRLYASLKPVHERDIE